MRRCTQPPSRRGGRRRARCPPSRPPNASSPTWAKGAFALAVLTRRGLLAGRDLASRRPSRRRRARAAPRGSDASGGRRRRARARPARPRRRPARRAATLDLVARQPRVRLGLHPRARRRGGDRRHRRRRQRRRDRGGARPRSGLDWSDGRPRRAHPPPRGPCRQRRGRAGARHRRDRLHGCRGHRRDQRPADPDRAGRRRPRVRPPGRSRHPATPPAASACWTKARACSSRATRCGRRAASRRSRERSSPTTWRRRRRRSRSSAPLTFETLLVGHGDPIESGASAAVAALAGG